MSEAARRRPATGEWVALVDGDGVRHVVRRRAVLALSDGDPAGDSTAVTIAGGRVLLVPRPLEEMQRRLAAWAT